MHVGVVQILLVSFSYLEPRITLKMMTAPTNNMHKQVKMYNIFLNRFNLEFGICIIFLILI